MRILIVFGTRPEAIKMAPLVKELQKYPEEFKVEICVTGQHREMLDQVLRIFKIDPDYDLSVMKQGQDLFDVTTGVLSGMKHVIEASQPELLLVHGDTTTSTSAALAAFYKRVPVGHIEAGLRTFNIYSPWPEEMNRSITGRIATYHFAPTQTSKQNLLKEAVSEDRIFVTGNTVIDALFLILEKINNNDNLRDQIEQILVKTGLPPNLFHTWGTGTVKSIRKLILITGHRRENFGEGFLNICQAIKSLAERHPDVDFIYPVHLNPNVRKPVYDILLNNKLDNVFIIEPLEYLSFVYLMSKSYLLLTDSGGIQEEAPSLGRPVLVMRNTTERPEAVEAGTAKLVGTNTERIIRNVEELLLNDDEYVRISKLSNPYGDGNASKRIVAALHSKIVQKEDIRPIF